MVKFSQNRQFFHIYISISETLEHVATKKLSPACSTYNSEQNEMSLPFIDGIFLMHRILEGNRVTLIGKIAWGQTVSMALIDIV